MPNVTADDDQISEQIGIRLLTPLRVSLRSMMDGMDHAKFAWLLTGHGDSRAASFRRVGRLSIFRTTVGAVAFPGSLDSGKLAEGVVLASFGEANLDAPAE